MGTSLLHRYNEVGLQSLIYQRSGGRSPLFSSTIEQTLDTPIWDALKLAATPPQQRQKRPQPRWTLKRLGALDYSSLRNRVLR